MIVKSSFLRNYMVSEAKIALIFFTLIIILLDSSLSFTQHRFSSSGFGGSVPYNLRNKFSWANYQTETYAQFISAWQTIIDNKPFTSPPRSGGITSKLMRGFFAFSRCSVTFINIK